MPDMNVEQVAIETKSIENNLNKAKSVEVKSAVTNNIIDNWEKPFWRSAASSENGAGSTSRVSTLAIVSVSLGLVVWLVIKTGKIPENLLQLGWFAAMLICTTYAPSKIAGIFYKFFTKVK
jgi:hypothetical protein